MKGKKKEIPEKKKVTKGNRKLTRKVRQRKVICKSVPSKQLEEKLCIIENVGVKYPGSLSVESAKIYFSWFII